MNSLLQILFSILMIFWLSYFLLNTKFEGYLERITREMGGRYARDRKLWSRLYAKRIYTFQAQLHRRHVIVRYTYLPLPSKRFRQDELEIELPVIQKFWLRIVRRSIEAESVEEISTGLQEFEPGFRIHSNQEEAARLFLANSYVRDQFRMLRGLFQKMEIYRGNLRVFYQSPLAVDFGQSDLEPAVSALCNLALFYEAQSIPLRITITRVSEFCPYCRESLQRELDRVVQCRQCGTNIHQICWEENAHCTTWGCSSTRAL
ncbi:MAG TPA: RING finger protein [Acidobacteriota bacterium]